MASGKVNRSNVWVAIAWIVIGVLLIIGGVSAAQSMMGWIVTILGVVWIIIGALDLAARNTVNGIVEMILGVLMVVFAWTISWVAFIVLGAALLVYGILGLVNHVGAVWVNIIHLLLGVFIVLLACGVEAVWEFTNILFYVAGGLMIVDGLLVLLAPYRHK
jgi:hypothetical protein